MADGRRDAANRDGPADGPDDDVVAPDESALLLDVMLGKLATYLRMCGYDAAYALDRGVEADDRIRALAADEDRRLLTRDRDLADRTPGAVLLTARDVDDQLRELRDAGFALSLPDEPTRCSACNGDLRRLRDDEPRPDHAPDDGPVWRCVDCGQCFWRGSHWADVERTLEKL
ncbi:Mut7-C RNAse domain-containing protein [Halobaculum sp. D14]|uniref:Mut7-C RNAse domain-containing protein n=1 Tax=Halobaculum sp. D14 TaxID=3421642 RepID=UPI003EBD9CDE